MNWWTAGGAHRSCGRLKTETSCQKTIHWESSLPKCNWKFARDHLSDHCEISEGLFIFISILFWSSMRGIGIYHASLTKIKFCGAKNFLIMQTSLLFVGNVLTRYNAFFEILYLISNISKCYFCPFKFYKIFT